MAVLLVVVLAIMINVSSSNHFLPRPIGRFRVPIKHAEHDLSLLQPQDYHYNQMYENSQYRKSDYNVPLYIFRHRNNMPTILKKTSFEVDTSETFDNDVKLKYDKLYDKNIKYDKIFDKNDKYDKLFDKNNEYNKLFDKIKYNKLYHKNDKYEKLYDKILKSDGKIYDKNFKYDKLFDKNDEYNKLFDKIKYNKLYDENDKYEKVYDKNLKYDDKLYDKNLKYNKLFDNNFKHDKLLDSDSKFEELFDKNGMIYLTPRGDNEDRKLNALMNKIVAYKMDGKNRYLRKPLSSVFEPEEIDRLGVIVQAINGEDGPVLPRTVYDFSELVV